MTKFQGAIDQMLSPEAMDIIVEGISAELCKENPTEECPMAVDGVIRAGLPLLAAAGADADFAQVSFRFGKSQCFKTFNS